MSDGINESNPVDFGNPATDAFKLENYPFYLLSIIDHRYGSAMESVLQKRKMERTEWQLLLILREQNPSSISELSERAGKKLSTVSRMIERMRNDEFVRTAPRQSDNRITDVFLNDSGLLALDKVLEVASKQYQRALSGFTDPEIQALRDQLQRILANLDRSPFE